MFYKKLSKVAASAIFDLQNRCHFLDPSTDIRHNIDSID